MFLMSARLVQFGWIGRLMATTSNWQARRMTEAWGCKARPWSHIVSNRATAGFRRLSGSTSGPGRWGASSFACWSTATSDSERLPLPIMIHPSPLTSMSAGGKFVILATEFGDRGDVRDLADWVEARIIR